MGVVAVASTEGKEGLTAERSMRCSTVARNTESAWKEWVEGGDACALGSACD